MTLPRRRFLQIAALFVPAACVAQRQENSDVPLVDQVPPLLDHILLGCNNLQKGIAFVEQRTGVRASFGGVHPGRGTQNALLSLGTQRYLEIIAPDPQQPPADNFLAKKVLSSTEPRLVGWAAHPRNIQALAAQLKQNGVPADGPTPGSRKRPDGKVLHWQTLNLKDDAKGLLPFFIEWSADSVHPSTDAPVGCQLLRLELLTPDPVAIDGLATKLSLDVPIARGDSPQIHAVLRGAAGTLSITS